MEALETIRQALPGYISGKRLEHTYAVERESAALAQIFSLTEEDTETLCKAALLHDITKTRTTEEQTELCRRFGIPYGETDLAAPKTFHAMTGAALAKADFPGLVTDTVCLAIRSHTVGRAGMTLLEKLLFLADYIEDTRTFEDCVTLRALFYDDLPAGREARLRHLDRVLVTAFDMTLSDLQKNGAIISPQTVAARNDLLLRVMRSDGK